MGLIRVLFLCTGNSARSQMAEAFLRKYAGDRFEVYSAGLEPQEIHPLTIQVMEEIGFDMSQHTSKPLSQFLGRLHFGYIITVCSRAAEKCPIFPGMGTRLSRPFDDPASYEGTPGEKLDKFREVRDAINRKIINWVDNLV